MSVSDASAPPGFRLHAVVGRGASSVVWEATQVSTDRRVALKLFHAGLQGTDDSRRFERERTLMGTLSAHPHIVTLYDAGLHEGRPWLALQLYDRGSYAARLATAGPLPVAEAITVLIAMAEALSVAHGRRIVHCDVKPGNIMVGDYGDPALGDFGVSRLLMTSHTRTAAGGYSLDHVAPELLDDDDDPTPACDVHSLATTVWELLCGRPPFRVRDERSAARVMRRILTEPLPPPPVPGVPAALNRLLAEMAAKDPQARPSVVSVLRTGRALQVGASRAATSAGTATQAAEDTPEPRSASSPAGGAAPPPPTDPAVDPRLEAGMVPGRHLEHDEHPQSDDERTRLDNLKDELDRTWDLLRVREGLPRDVDPHADTGGVDPLEATRLRARAQTASDRSGRADGPGRPRDSPAAVGPTPSRRRKRTILIVSAVVLVLVASGVVALLTSRLAPPTLLGAGEVGDGAFTPDFTNGTALPGLALASSRPAGVGPGSDVAGATEALYRGDKGRSGCDRDGLGRFLAGRPALAASWIQALAADPQIRWPERTAPSSDSVGEYLTTLTPVLLRSDVAVTAYEHAWLRAAARPAVLQAGTAVLIDLWGVPRVRCKDGAPLDIATRPTAELAVRGDGFPWPGYDPTAVITVHTNPEEISQFGLVGRDDKSPFRRPAASTGGGDFDQDPRTATLDGTNGSPGSAYHLTGTQTSCDLNQCDALQAFTMNIVVTHCSESACQASESTGEWQGQLVLIGQDDSWTLSRVASGNQEQTCTALPTSATLALNLHATDATIHNTVWTATAIAGYASEASSTNSGCYAGSVAWHFTGTRQ